MGKNTKRSEFGTRLLEIRKKRFPNQTMAANALGMNRDAYARYELQTFPLIPTLIKICEVFELSSDELLGIKPFGKDSGNSEGSKINQINYMESISDFKHQPLNVAQPHSPYNTSTDTETVELNNWESELLDIFRRLPPEKQESLLKFISTY